MANLYITEFRDAVDGVPLAGPVAEQVVTFTTTTQSAALNGSTRLVRLMADANAHIAYGANPTATTSNMKVPANTAILLRVEPGQGLKFAAVTGT